VTARTAGFSSVDLAAMGAPALLVMIALMFIGAGPGSTGGGIKVTTFAVLFATFRAERASAPAPTLFGREVPQSVQRKAIVVTFLSLTLVALMAFLILVFEDQPPLFVFYETTSAFGSVGCSTGIETKMGPIGKLLLTLTMMIGRIGPLTFALAAAGKVRSVTYRLPEERVMIG
jgi:trk system potassium uptake protein